MPPDISPKFLFAGIAASVLIVAAIAPYRWTLLLSELLFFVQKEVFPSTPNTNPPSRLQFPSSSPVHESISTIPWRHANPVQYVLGAFDELCRDTYTHINLDIYAPRVSRYSCLLHQH